MAPTLETSRPASELPSTVPHGSCAGFSQRLAAALVDLVLLGLVTLVVVAASGAAGYGVGIVVAAAYFAYFEGGPSGQTVGKRFLGIRVYRLRDGGRLGYAGGVGRAFGRILSAIPLFLGYFWMIGDGEKQCWHDKLVGTVVVPVSAYPVRW